MSHGRPGMTLPLGFVLAMALATIAPASAETDTFAAKTLTIMVPFPPGGRSDVVTRLVAAKVAESLKTTVVIDNRGGGGGVPRRSR